MHDEHAVKVRPSDLEVGVGVLLKPHFVLVALIIGRTAQYFEGAREVESSFTRVLSEETNFFEVMGRAALNKCSCFTAAA